MYIEKTPVLKVTLILLGLLLVGVGLAQAYGVTILAAVSDTTPPEIRILTPSQGETITANSLPVSVDLAFSIVEPESDTDWKVYLDGNLYNGLYGTTSPTSGSIFVNTLSISTSGSHTILVTGTSAGGSGSDSVTITVQYSPPEVIPEISILEPTAGSFVKGTVSVKVQVTKYPEAVSSMSCLWYNPIGQLKVDKPMSKISADTWRTLIDTTTIPDTTYTVKINIQTTTGTYIYDVISVTIDNVPPEVNWPWILLALLGMILLIVGIII